MRSPVKGEKVQVSSGRGKPFEVTLTGSGNCKRCGGFIEWARTGLPNPRNIPLDSRPDRETGLYVSHFATCPNADEFRRPR